MVEMGLPGWKRKAPFTKTATSKSVFEINQNTNALRRQSSINSQKKNEPLISEQEEPQDSLADFCNEYPIFIFHPYEPIRLRWDMTVMAIMLYVLLDIPVRICFSIDLHPNHPWEILNLMVDIFFMIDIVFAFHTGFIRESQFITDKSEIAKRYLSGWFWIDLITSIPFGRIAAALPDSSSTNSSLAMLPRLLRFMKIARMFKLLRVLKLVKMMSNWEDQDSGSAASLRLLKFLCIVFLMAHIAGCMWMGVATLYRAEPYEDGTFPGDYLGYHEDSWPVRHDFWDKDKLELYLYTLYWAFTTLTTVGYGDITAQLPLEVGWTILIMILGTSLFGYIIGNVASLMTHEDETAMLVKAKIQSVLAYMRYRDFPDTLARKIRRHYEYSWKRSQVYNEEEILSELPHTVRTECALHIHKDTIAKVPFLADLGEDVVPLLVTRLRPMLAAHGDLIIREGMFGDEMYFVAGGTLRMEAEVYSNAVHSEEVLVRKLHVGEYFAEYAVIMDQPKHPISVRAAAYCDLFMLNRDNFNDFGEIFPEVYMKVIQMGRERFLTLMKELNRRKTQHIMNLNVKKAKARDEALRRRQRTPSGVGVGSVRRGVRSWEGSAAGRLQSESSSSSEEDEGLGDAPKTHQPAAMDSVVTFGDRLRYHREHRERLDEGRLKAERRRERAAKREAAERRREERAKALARPADGRELERRLSGLYRFKGVASVAQAVSRFGGAVRRSVSSLGSDGGAPRHVAAQARAAAQAQVSSARALAGGAPLTHMLAADEEVKIADEESGVLNKQGSSSRKYSVRAGKIVPTIAAPDGDAGGLNQHLPMRGTASLTPSNPSLLQDAQSSSDRPLLDPSPHHANKPKMFNKEMAKTYDGFLSDGPNRDRRRSRGLIARFREIRGTLSTRRRATTGAERSSSQPRALQLQVSFKPVEGVETGRDQAPVLLTTRPGVASMGFHGNHDEHVPPPSRQEEEAADELADGKRTGRAGRQPRQGIMLRQPSKRHTGTNLMSMVKTGGLNMTHKSGAFSSSNSNIDPEELARAQARAQQQLLELAAEEARPKFSFFVMMRIQVWKQKAQLAVAMRKMNVVELRHQQKYAGGGASNGRPSDNGGGGIRSRPGTALRARGRSRQQSADDIPRYNPRSMNSRLETLTVQQAELRMETRLFQAKLGAVEAQLAASNSLLAAIAQSVGADLSAHLANFPAAGAAGSRGGGAAAAGRLGRQVSAPSARGRPVLMAQPRGGDGLGWPAALGRPASMDLPAQPQNRRLGDMVLESFVATGRTDEAFLASMEESSVTSLGSIRRSSLSPIPGRRSSLSPIPGAANMQRAPDERGVAVIQEELSPAPMSPLSVGVMTFQ